MNKITFQIRLSPSGTHIAQAVENGKVIAVSKEGHTNSEAAISDVREVLVENQREQAISIIYAPKGVGHANQPNKTTN